MSLSTPLEIQGGHNPSWVSTSTILRTNKKVININKLVFLPQITWDTESPESSIDSISANVKTKYRSGERREEIQTNTMQRVYAVLNPQEIPHLHDYFSI